MLLSLMRCALGCQSAVVILLLPSLFTELCFTSRNYGLIKRLIEVYVLILIDEYLPKYA